MRRIAAALLAMAIGAGTSQAAVESDVVMTMELGGTPLDTTMSGDGRLFFVLTTQGMVEIFTDKGEKTGSIEVGKGADLLLSSPEGDFLYVTDREKNETKLVTVDFVHSIRTDQAPFKGKTDAPVVITVFSDFQ